MWVFSKTGFFSVVESEVDPGKVLVRARAREDLVALKKRYLRDAKIFAVPSSDYAFRMIVWKAEWVSAIVEMAWEIDYPNFKDAVPSRKRLYGEVWLTMSELQKILPYSTKGYKLRDQVARAAFDNKQPRRRKK